MLTGNHHNRTLARATRALSTTGAIALGALLAACTVGADSNDLDPDRGDPVGHTLGPSINTNSNQVTFRIFSANAERVEVHIFAQATGADEVASYQLSKNNATDVWSVIVPMSELAPYGISDHVFYGYRIWGPNWPYDAAWTKGSEVGFISDVDGNGNRFNPNKLLSDPYALELSHDPVTASNPDGTYYASGPLYRAIDNGQVAPKSIAFVPEAVSIGTKPTRAFKDDVVYEVHVRGLTMNDPSIPAGLRGTYAGAAQKAAELADLGITAIEFLPIHETVNDVNEATPSSTSGDNYWGYMTVNFFAPDRRYAADQSPGGPTREFKEMVRAFHDQGIKVYIDVVYNHTAEGGNWFADDPSTFNLYSYRGIDNSTYYSLTNDRQFNYDNTGVGGNFNTYNPVPQQIIVDSLRYYSDNMGVDGYRFDLAAVLGNTCEHGCFNYDKLDGGTALNRIWNELDPRPAQGGEGIDLIAEPWAIGGNSYQVGNFPAGWIEWNGTFRDTIRADQNMMGTESVSPGQLATRIAGSSDMFQDDGRRPWNSVNFMVAHDGFTLNDLYTCNEKQNDQPWPYGPSDGGEDHNRSWDQGGNPADQRRAARNGFALTMLSAGVPMMTGGDEHLRSQSCNNNAYNLDSDKNWLDYALDADQQNFRAFVQDMIAFRKAHPALRPDNFYSANDENGNILEQMRWFKPDGNQADGGYMDNINNHALAWRIDSSEFNDPADAIYVAYNGWEGAVDFTLPWPGPDRNWYRVTDTCNWAEGGDQVRAPGNEDFIGGEYTSYGVCARGLLLLIAK